MDAPEMRKETVNLSFSVIEHNVDASVILLKWSPFSKMIRIYSYVFRFIQNSRSKTKSTGSITISEIDFTVLRLCKIIKNERFNSEISSLKSDQSISRNSKILNLNPFLDDKGILRVCGRLYNSDLPYSRKHQVILPGKHWFVELLIKNYHYKFLHAGTQLVLSQIRKKFWLVNGR